MERWYNSPSSNVGSILVFSDCPETLALVGPIWQKMETKLENRIQIIDNKNVSFQRSKWKKLENALIFINKSRSSAKISKSTQTVSKKSKWLLLKNVIWAVNYFSKLNLTNLKLRQSLICTGNLVNHNKLNIGNI